MLHRSDSSNSIIDKIEKTWEGIEIKTKPELAQSIAEGMADYLRSYPAPASYKQKLWDSCNQWYRRTAGRLGVSDGAAFEEEMPRPVERDLGVDLVKALHDAGGKTKEQLGKDLGVGEKTIQTELRALDPSLQERGKRVRPLRLAGQELHPQIQVREQTDPDNPRITKRLYHTENRLHPIALQLNTQEAATLLLALFRRYDEEGSILSLEMALDIWDQLSDPGKDRIKEIYGDKEIGFRSFIEEIEAELEEGRLIVFHSEDEQRELLSGDELCMNLFKNADICHVKIRRGGTKYEIPKARIIREGHKSWIAVPSDEYPDKTNAISFTEQDLVDIR